MIQQPHNLHKHAKAYGQAHAKLVDWLLQFSLARSLSNGRLFCSSPFEVSSFTELRKDDLVIMGSMRDPEFRLSWFLGEIRKVEGGFMEEALFRSTRTGREAWWTNVDVSRFREADQIDPTWRFTNEQMDLQKRWNKACAEIGLMSALPLVFEDDHIVQLDARIKYGIKPPAWAQRIHRAELNYRRLVATAKFMWAMHEASRPSTISLLNQ